MSLTPSTMLPLGTKAPYFSLPDPDGIIVSLQDYREAKAFLIIFMCNHCPFVKHIQNKLTEVTKQFIEQGVAVIGINSNDFITYPDDSPSKMKEEIIKTRMILLDCNFTITLYRKCILNKWPNPLASILIFA